MMPYEPDPRIIGSKLIISALCIGTPSTIIFGILIALVVNMCGCVDGLGDPELRKFDINEYIADNCTGEGTPLYITTEFSGLEERIIADALDDTNDALGTELELCGVLYDTPLKTSSVIMLGPDDIAAYGYYTGPAKDDIYLWPTRCKCNDHFRKVVLHEIGHMLRKDGEHLEGYGNVMASGWHGITNHTDEDIDFLLVALERGGTK